MSEQFKLLCEKDAADLLKLSPRTLQRLRLEGCGPLYIQLTARRLAYREADLLSWIASRSRVSTSAPAGGR